MLDPVFNGVVSPWLWFSSIGVAAVMLVAMPRMARSLKQPRTRDPQRKAFYDALYAAAKKP